MPALICTANYFEKDYSITLNYILEWTKLSGVSELESFYQ